MVPLPDLSYKGGNRVRTEGEPEIQQREPHRKMVGKPEQYGIKKFPGNPPSYKGKYLYPAQSGASPSALCFCAIPCLFKGRGI